MMNTLFLP